MCTCSHHQSSVCAEQCKLSCDWQSILADRAGKSGHTLARHSTSAELEAGGADTHSCNPPARNQTQIYNDTNNQNAYQKLKLCADGGFSHVFLTLASTWPVFVRA